MEKHFIGKVAQKAIIVKDGKALITLDANDGNVWGLPGGRLNIGEDPKVGLQREIQEELGVAVTVGNVIHLETFLHSRNNDPHLFLIYEAILKDPTQDFTLHAEEAAKIKWIDAGSLTDQQIYETYTRALEVYFYMNHRTL